MKGRYDLKVRQEHQTIVIEGDNNALLSLTHHLVSMAEGPDREHGWDDLLDPDYSSLLSIDSLGFYLIRVASHQVRPFDAYRNMPSFEQLGTFVNIVRSSKYLEFRFSRDGLIWLSSKIILMTITKIPTILFIHGKDIDPESSDIEIRQLM